MRLVCKHNVVADGIRQGIYCSSGLGCSLIGMNAHPAEIVSKAGFQDPAGYGVKWLAGRTEYFVNDGWCDVSIVSASSLRCSSFALFRFLATLFALFSRSALALTGTLTL